MRFTRFNEPVPVVTKSGMPQLLSSSNPAALPPHRRRVTACLLSALLLTFSAAAAHAQDVRRLPDPDYTSIVVFGDSLSDTGNVANLTLTKYGVEIPGPDADYTAGRFTDGADTLPPAEKYFGVWVEQLAATFPSNPPVVDSLDGGTNYAYGFATTGSGTGVFTFGPSDSLFVNVDNVGQQITDYLATKPKITSKTLFVVWGGAIDVLYATSSDDVINAGINQTLNIQRLVDAGATQFIIPNLPPLGSVPRLNGSPATSVPATEASALYNEVLSGGVDLLRFIDFAKHPQFSELDVFSLFNHIVASPSSYSLVNVTMSSQAMAVDPDSYLFWDDLHPTTHGHNILAVTAAEILAQAECRKDFAATRSLNEAQAACTDLASPDLAGASR
ncbi:MAG TPA: SGNH/GDSL hydrolase family protein [Acidobacteriaceae bacterium]|nr:SGNH/GDSL hydrolase family protein [Acidobacteriaceae bacterium]